MLAKIVLSERQKLLCKVTCLLRSRTAGLEVKRGKYEEIIGTNMKDRKERVYNDMTQGKVERRRRRIGR